jgi:glycolate oxidase iron-sulfur subunit
MSDQPLEPATHGHFGPGSHASPAGDPEGSAIAPPDRLLLDLADQCVMCGLCLPHCPTYRISLDEAESPRGRIALARSIAGGRLAPSPTALAHLDQCLACLSCQKVCPSEVRYEEIITRTRAALAPQRERPDFVSRLLTNPQRLTSLARMGALLRASRWLPWLARAFPYGSRWRALGERIPELPVAAPAHPIRSLAHDRGRVTLFLGCVASVYDRDTHAAARSLLEALGYEVAVPQGTPCCGALARHAGDAAAAYRLSSEARAALAATGGETVLVSASGCFGDLRDHASSEAGPAIVDISAFIARDEAFSRLRFRPLAARAVLHLPCTQVNVVGAIPSIRALLARIPGLTVLDLPEQPRCCGAAGAYAIEHPEIADRLLAEKLDQAKTQQPDLILTTNIGCRMHLANGLRDRNAEVPVVHPLALLAQQLENDAP